MCNFFSFLSDGKGGYIYADSVTRKDNPGVLHDSHSWLAGYFLGTGASKLEDLYNKYEFNPFTKKFIFDNRGCSAEDDSVSAEAWVNELDFGRIVPKLIIKPIVNPLSGNYRIPTQVDIDNLNKWINIRDRSRDYRGSRSIYSSLDRFSRDIGGIWGIINIIERGIKEGFGYRFENIATSVYEVYVASFFDIEYEFDISPIDELFNRGFVPTFDGYTWRLISGVDLKVVFSQHVAWRSI